MTATLAKFLCSLTHNLQSCWTSESLLCDAFVHLRLHKKVPSQTAVEYFAKDGILEIKPRNTFQDLVFGRSVSANCVNENSTPHQKAVLKQYLKPILTIDITTKSLKKTLDFHMEAFAHRA